MGRTIYVGNLPYSTGDSEIRQLFSSIGTAETVSIVTDRETGRPRGFAFVEMTTAEEAAQAIAALDQSELDGRRLTVREARPKAVGGGPSRRTEPRW